MLPFCPLLCETLCSFVDSEGCVVLESYPNICLRKFFRLSISGKTYDGGLRYDIITIFLSVNKLPSHLSKHDSAIGFHNVPDMCSEKIIAVHNPIECKRCRWLYYTRFTPSDIVFENSTIPTYPIALPSLTLVSDSVHCLE